MAANYSKFNSVVVALEDLKQAETAAKALTGQKARSQSYPANEHLDAYGEVLLCSKTGRHVDDRGRKINATQFYENLQGRVEGLNISRGAIIRSYAIQSIENPIVLGKTDMTPYLYPREAHGEVSAILKENGPMTIGALQDKLAEKRSFLKDTLHCLFDNAELQQLASSSSAEDEDETEDPEGPTEDAEPAIAGPQPHHPMMPYPTTMMIPNGSYPSISPHPNAQQAPQALLRSGHPQQQHSAGGMIGANGGALVFPGMAMAGANGAVVLHPGAGMAVSGMVPGSHGGYYHGGMPGGHGWHNPAALDFARAHYEQSAASNNIAAASDKFAQAAVDCTSLFKEMKHDADKANREKEEAQKKAEEERKKAAEATRLQQVAEAQKEAQLREAEAKRQAAEDKVATMEKQPTTVSISPTLKNTLGEVLEASVAAKVAAEATLQQSAVKAPRPASAFDSNGSPISSFNLEAEEIDLNLMLGDKLKEYQEAGGSITIQCRRKTDKSNAPQGKFPMQVLQLQCGGVHVEFSSTFGKDTQLFEGHGGNLVVVVEVPTNLVGQDLRPTSVEMEKDSLQHCLQAFLVDGDYVFPKVVPVASAGMMSLIVESLKTDALNGHNLRNSLASLGDGKCLLMLVSKEGALDEEFDDYDTASSPYTTPGLVEFAGYSTSFPLSLTLHDGNGKKVQADLELLCMDPAEIQQQYSHLVEVLSAMGGIQQVQLSGIDSGTSSLPMLAGSLTTVVTNGNLPSIQFEKFDISTNQQVPLSKSKCQLLFDGCILKGDQLAGSDLIQNTQNKLQLHFKGKCPSFKTLALGLQVSSVALLRLEDISVDDNNIKELILLVEAPGLDVVWNPPDNQPIDGGLVLDKLKRKGQGGMLTAKKFEAWKEELAEEEAKRLSKHKRGFGRVGEMEVVEEVDDEVMEDMEEEERPAKKQRN